jgi:hypothetical protein
MDCLEILNAKNISDSSKKLYLANLHRLNDNKEIKNFGFLKSPEKVMEKIAKYKPNTQRSYIISIVTLLKECNGKKKLYDSYYSILEKMNTDLKVQTVKTEKEEKNWISDDEIKKVMSDCIDKVRALKSKKKVSREEYEDLLRCVTVGLFVLQVPRRNLDYLKMIVVKKYEPQMSDDYNYLDLKNNKFIFNNYKTKGTYQQQTTGVEPDMRVILDIYLKFHPNKKEHSFPLLVDADGDALTSMNAITRLLYKIFNKKIGSSMLRKIYLTHKYADTIEDLKKDTAMMGTSVSTAKNNYIKED